MAFNYGYEKLWEAVASLTCSTESLQNRAAHAFTNSVMHIDPITDMPEPLRDRLYEFRTASGWPNPTDQATVLTERMEDEEARLLIRKIVSLMGSLPRYHKLQ